MAPRIFGPIISGRNTVIAEEVTVINTETTTERRPTGSQGEDVMIATHSVEVTVTKESAASVLARLFGADPGR